MSTLFTLLLPTRGRQTLAKNVIDSWFENANNKDSLQVIVKIDHDDSFEYNHPNVIIVKSDRLNGYPSLHKYCNMMLGLVTGVWVGLGNDDALVTTKGWDDILCKESDSPAILLNTTSKFGPTEIFPIVPTRILKKVGFFSQNAYTDRWLQSIFVNKKDIQININHINDSIDDQTRTDRANAPCNSGIDWDSTAGQREELKHMIKNE